MNKFSESNGKRQKLVRNCRYNGQIFHIAIRRAALLNVGPGFMLTVRLTVMSSHLLVHPAVGAETPPPLPPPISINSEKC